MSLKVGTEAEIHLAGQNLILAKDNKELKEKLQAVEEENRMLIKAVEELDCENYCEIQKCIKCRTLEKVSKD